MLHGILQVEETTVKEMDTWKASPRDNVLLKISNGAPISRWLTDASDHNRNYNFSTWPDNVPTILCYFLAAEHFVTCLRNKAHVYLLTYIKFTAVETLRRQAGTCSIATASKRTHSAGLRTAFTYLLYYQSP